MPGVSPYQPTGDKKHQSDIDQGIDAGDGFLERMQRIDNGPSTPDQHAAAAVQIMRTRCAAQQFDGAGDHEKGAHGSERKANFFFIDEFGKGIIRQHAGHLDAEVRKECTTAISREL
jgi:hypothetical protein